MKLMKTLMVIVGLSGVGAVGYYIYNKVAKRKEKKSDVLSARVAMPDAVKDQIRDMLAKLADKKTSKTQHGKIEKELQQICAYYKIDRKKIEEVVGGYQIAAKSKVVARKA